MDEFKKLFRCTGINCYIDLLERMPAENKKEGHNVLKISKIRICKTVGVCFVLYDDAQNRPRRSLIC